MPLIELPARSGGAVPGKALVSLTFDDGYANFLSTRGRFPILQRRHAPATVFIITSLIGESTSSLDEWPVKHRDLRRPTRQAMNWAQVEACRHSPDWSPSVIPTAIRMPECPLSPPERRHCRGRYCAGDWAMIMRTYAYPYGCTRLGRRRRPTPRSRAAGFQVAVTTDLDLASAESNLFCCRASRRTRWIPPCCGRR